MCYTKLVGQFDDWKPTSIIMFETTGLLKTIFK